MRFDLLVKGGEVVDPGSGRRGRYDVAVNRNRIAAVDRDIPADAAARARPQAAGSASVRASTLARTEAGTGPLSACRTSVLSY